jgi:ParB/RepB/Spo0J family partition protein
MSTFLGYVNRWGSVVVKPFDFADQIEAMRSPSVVAVIPGIEAENYDSAMAEANRRVDAGEVIKTFAAVNDPISRMSSASGANAPCDSGASVSNERKDPLMKTGEIESSKPKTPGVRGDGQWTIGDAPHSKAPSSKEDPMVPNPDIIARAEALSRPPNRLKPELQPQLQPSASESKSGRTTVTWMPIRVIAPSKTNPRRTFDPAKLKELAESVKQHGVLQPVLLRPIGPWAENLVPGAELLDAMRRMMTGNRFAPDEPLFEIVAGERRWRAATMADLQEIPAIVRILDDKTVLEVQVIENLQRDDLTPMEEAEGYERLIKQHGYTAAAIAEKISKSKEYVYARVKLTALCPAGRAALAQGHLTTEVALLLARLPTRELQEEVLEEENIAGNEHEGPMPVKKVRELLKRDYMLHLKTAAWDLADAALHPPAGPCSSCPKRTINARELFPDMGNADVCTDPPCFKLKREAWGTRQLAAARQAGQEVFEGKAAEKLFYDYGDHHLRDDRYVDLTDRCEALGFEHKQHWKGTLAKACPKPIVTVDPDGKVRELVRREDALKALKERGLKPKATPTSTPANDRYMQEQRERTKKKQRLAAIAQSAVTAALPKATSMALDPTATRHEQFWRLMARAAYDRTDIDTHAFIAKRRGLAAVQTKARDALQKWLKGDPSPEECEAFVIECLVGARWWGSWSYETTTFGKEFKEFCALAKVDLEKMSKEKPQKPTARLSSPKSKGTKKTKAHGRQAKANGSALPGARTTKLRRGGQTPDV